MNEVAGYFHLRIDLSPLRQAIAQAGRFVGYPLAKADPLRAVSAIHTPVLYLAGAKDPVAPLRDVQCQFSSNGATVFSANGAR